MEKSIECPYAIIINERSPIKCSLQKGPSTMCHCCTWRPCIAKWIFRESTLKCVLRNWKDKEQENKD